MAGWLPAWCGVAHMWPGLDGWPLSSPSPQGPSPPLEAPSLPSPHGPSPPLTSPPLPLPCPPLPSPALPPPLMACMLVTDGQSARDSAQGAGTGRKGVYVEVGGGGRGAALLGGGEESTECTCGGAGGMTAGEWWRGGGVRWGGVAPAWPARGGRPSTCGSGRCQPRGGPRTSPPACISALNQFPCPPPAHPPTPAPRF